MVSLLAAVYAIHSIDDTPQKALHTLSHALNVKDWGTVLKLFDGKDISSKVADLKQASGSGLLTMHVSFQIKKTVIKGTTATIYAKERISDGSSEYVRLDDVIHLKRKAEHWTILGGKDANSVVSILADGATYSKADEVKLRASVDATLYKSSLLTIAIGVSTYCDNNDSKLDLNQTDLEAKVQPLLPKGTKWQTPKGKHLDVQLNPNITGLIVDDIRDRGTCVLLSIGPKDKLELINGMALIAFADYTCKYVTQAEAEKLRWDPK